MTCSVPGCERVHKGHGLCAPHLARFNRSGDVEAGRPIRPVWTTAAPEPLTCKCVEPEPRGWGDCAKCERLIVTPEVLAAVDDWNQRKAQP